MLTEVFCSAINKLSSQLMTFKLESTHILYKGRKVLLQDQININSIGSWTKATKAFNPLRQIELNESNIML